MSQIQFNGTVHAMRSDMLKGQVIIAFAFSLGENTMALREQLATLKVMDTAVSVTVARANKSKSNDNQLPLPEPDGTTVTLSAVIDGETRSVSMSGKEFERAAEQFPEYAAQKNARL